MLPKGVCRSCCNHSSNRRRPRSRNSIHHGEVAVCGLLSLTGWRDGQTKPLLSEVGRARRSKPTLYHTHILSLLLCFGPASNTNTYHTQTAATKASLYLRRFANMGHQKGSPTRTRRRNTAHQYRSVVHYFFVSRIGRSIPRGRS